MTAKISITSDELVEILKESLPDRLAGVESVEDVEYDDEDQVWIATVELAAREEDEEEKD